MIRNWEGMFLNSHTNKSHILVFHPTRELSTKVQVCHISSRLCGCRMGLVSVHKTPCMLTTTDDQHIRLAWTMMTAAVRLGMISPQLTYV